MDSGNASWPLAKKQETLQSRAMMIRAIRRFFEEQDYLDIETPVRIPAPAPEEHIDAVSSGDWFLQTSPELCMKRLLAAGYPRLYQISKCFRAHERGSRHLPEFTMLEWYRSGIDYHDLMQECEALILFIAQVLKTGDTLVYQGNRIVLQAPWKRLSVAEAFDRYASMTMQKSLKKDCFDDIMAGEIEPKLGCGHPVFLYDYPVEYGALARVSKRDRALAERFELYVNGLELANAFSELTDEREQRSRFEQARFRRFAESKSVTPMPEPFLASLRHMPEAAGMAVGIDRLAMLFTDSAAIDEVVAFPPEML